MRNKASLSDVAWVQGQLEGLTMTTGSATLFQVTGQNLKNKERGMNVGKRNYGSLSLLTLFLVSFLLLTTACEIPISATATPAQTVGSTVFSAVYWRNPDQAIDVVFIPDGRYGDMTNVSNRQAFLDDVSGLISSGFWQNNVIARNLTLFNFWFMTTTGDVQAPQPGQICPTVTWPNLTGDAAFAEVFILVHSTGLRNCAFGNRVTTGATGFRTVVHELSHAAFGLPDEYCCDGGYWHLPPVLYNSQNGCLNDATNAAWRDCRSFTANSGQTWWRSEGENADIMRSGGATVWEYGPADWVIVEQVLIDLIGSPSVNPPTVFAPDNWNWP
jgi:hypothetical protein